MSDRGEGIAARIAGAKRPAAPVSGLPEEAEGFSTANKAGVRQQDKLDLRFKTGGRQCFSYYYFRTAKFDPSGSVVIDFSGSRITLEGRNLEPLYDEILSQRLAMVREVDAFADDSPEAATVVTVIRVESI